MFGRDQIQNYLSGLDDDGAEAVLVLYVMIHAVHNIFIKQFETEKQEEETEKGEYGPKLSCRI